MKGISLHQVAIFENFTIDPKEKEKTFPSNSFDDSKSETLLLPTMNNKK
jgi:hypothetical protein